MSNIVMPQRNNTSSGPGGWGFMGILALLAPLAYIGGRFAADFTLPTPWDLVASGATMIALGVVLGIPVGLFFGTRSLSKDAPEITSDIQQQIKILQQIREELNQNKALFEARKGNANFLTRIDYLTSFWVAAKSSGQLLVMHEPKLLSTIANAYYWIDQANRLEALAYESQYRNASSTEGQNITSVLISEVRSLDGPLGAAISAAIASIDTRLTASTK